MKNPNLWFLWNRWVVANALGELIGLGLTLATGYLVFTVFGEARSIWMSVLNLALMTASGAIEGAIVGAFQWQALASWFPQITEIAWVRATIFGALVAWFAGSLPFSLIDMGSQATGSTAAEPAQWLVSLGAAGIGLVAGAVLAYFQWRALRGRVKNSGWWIPANSLAWAAGMPLIFWGIDKIQQMATLLAVISLAGLLLLAGATVGAIHGSFLVWFARHERLAALQANAG